MVTGFVVSFRYMANRIDNQQTLNEFNTPSLSSQSVRLSSSKPILTLGKCLRTSERFVLLLRSPTGAIVVLTIVEQHPLGCSCGNAQLQAIDHSDDPELCNRS